MPAWPLTTAFYCAGWAGYYAAKQMLFMTVTMIFLAGVNARLVSRWWRASRDS